MPSKIYVGNLSYSTKETDLEQLLTPFGALASVDLIYDKMSGRSKGFAFVTFETDEAASNAIAELDGKDFQGRPIRVNAAVEKSEGDRGGGRRFDRPRGGGGGRGDDRGGGGGFNRDRGDRRRSF